MPIERRAFPEAPAPDSPGEGRLSAAAVSAGKGGNPAKSRESVILRNIIHLFLSPGICLKFLNFTPLHSEIEHTEDRGDVVHYGSRAKDWITDHDVTQKKLAKEFHITEAMFSNYLNGRNDIPVEILVKIAQYFEITTDYLVGLSDSPVPTINLTRAERDLIDGFRALSKNQKELIMQNIRLMCEQNQR